MKVNNQIQNIIGLIRYLTSFSSSVVTVNTNRSCSKNSLIGERVVAFSLVCQYIMSHLGEEEIAGRIWRSAIYKDLAGQCKYLSFSCPK